MKTTSLRAHKSSVAVSLALISLTAIAGCSSQDGTGEDTGETSEDLNTQGLVARAGHGAYVPPKSTSSFFIPAVRVSLDGACTNSGEKFPSLESGELTDPHDGFLHIRNLVVITNSSSAPLVVTLRFPGSDLLQSLHGQVIKERGRLLGWAGERVTVPAGGFVELSKASDTSPVGSFAITCQGSLAHEGLVAEVRSKGRNKDVVFPTYVIFDRCIWNLADHQPCVDDR